MVSAVQAKKGNGIVKRSVDTRETVEKEGAHRAETTGVGAEKGTWDKNQVMTGAHECAVR